MKSLEDISAIRDKMQDEINVRRGAASADGKRHVLVCGGTGCTSSGSQKIIDAFEAEIKKNGIEDKADVVKTGCHGLCALGPIVLVYPEG